MLPPSCKRNPRKRGASYAGKALCSSRNVSTRKYDLPAAKGLLPCRLHITYTEIPLVLRFCLIEYFMLVFAIQFSVC